MKMLIFGASREEQSIILEIQQCMQLEKVVFEEGILEYRNIEKVQDYDAIWIMTNSVIGEREAKRLKEYGVKYIISRATGIDHLDVEALRRYGIRAANVPSYSPNAISEHTIMLLLMALRNMKKNQHMVEKLDYRIQGLCGREIRKQTIGVVGSGRIGQLTIAALNGLDVKVLVHSRTERPEIAKLATYVSMDELYRYSDVIILHCPLTKENYHMICEDSLSMCKEKMVLINTARGGLVDGEAVLRNLKSGKIESFAMDVYEGEDDFIRTTCDAKTHPNATFLELCSREDVIYTAHVGFLTDQARYEIIRISMENAEEYEKTGTCSNEIT